MSNLLSIELKNDLENLYKISGDLLNIIESKTFDKESKEIQDLMDLIKFRLEDIGGTLQKDIFNCNYLITKTKFQHVNEGIHLSKMT